MHYYYEETFYGVKVQGTYYFKEGEPQTYDYPGSPAMVELLTIFIGDQDATELLEDKVEEIERQILEKYHS